MISKHRKIGNETVSDAFSTVFTRFSSYDDTNAKFIIDENNKVTYEGPENPIGANMIIINKSNKSCQLQKSAIDETYIFPYAHNKNGEGMYFNIDRGIIDKHSEYNLGVPFDGNAKTYLLGWNINDIKDNLINKCEIKSCTLFKKGRSIVGGEIVTAGGNVIKIDISEVKDNG